MDFLHFVQEILDSIKQNKTRSILAGFGVAWGIFILILLLGTGEGFRQGILRLFSAFAKNSIWVYGGEISERNLSKTIHHKAVLFDNTDISIAKAWFPEIEFISPELTSDNSLISYGQNTAYAQIKGVFPDYFKVKIIKAEKGRLLNHLDNKEHRRVALIGSQIADMLFGNGKAFGKPINIAGTFFSVIGIIEKGSFFTQNEQNAVYIPYTTFRDCLNRNSEYNAFVLTVTKNTNTGVFENDIKSFLARRKGFDPKDKKAVFILNFDKEVKVFNKLFNAVDVFLWFIGLCLLLSGIVGISNIMLVIVKERTFEIGIRKAIGASPKSIVWMVICESIIITTMAGIIGLLLGMAIISLINWIITSFSDTTDSLFTSAAIDFPVILFSLFILILSGVIAGFLPAKKAANITPAEAIRYENR